MSDWLIAVDSSKYDDIEKLNKIEWNEANKDEINQGDTVYLHIAKKNVSSILKCKVNTTESSMEFELLDTFTGPMYSKENLMEKFGFPENPLKPYPVSSQFLGYLQNFPKFTCTQNESVWLAVAFLSYNLYKSGERRWPFFYFKCDEVLKCAKTKFNKYADPTQFYGHNNADYKNKDPNSNYLRGTLPCSSDSFTLRRLTMANEFPKNTMPSKLNKDVQIGEIKIGDLFNFVENDYPNVFKAKVDYISILDYLKNNANKEYKGANNRSNKSEEIKFGNLYEIASKACDEFNRIPDIFCNSPIIKLDGKIDKSQWLNGGKNKIRDYLWIQMRKKKYQEDPTSISIFAQFDQLDPEQIDQLDPEQTCFRVALETKDEKRDFKHYHNHLNKPLNKDAGLVYVSGTNFSKALRLEGTDTESVKNRLNDGSINKVQICKYIRQKPGQTNEYFEYEIAKAIRDLMPYYDFVVNNGKPEKSEEMKEQEQMINELTLAAQNELQHYPRNLILYGPPGTGKTYNSVIYAVSICEKRPVGKIKQEDYSEILKRYREYTEEGRIAFTTFHQSYGYEEFIEGIKPRLSDDNNENNKSLDYILEDGIFKKFCLNAKDISLNSDSFTTPAKSKIWGMYLGGSGKSSIKTECFNNNEIRIGFRDISDEDIDVTETNNLAARQMLNSFINEMEIGDIVLIAENIKHIDAIGIITGDYEYEESREDYARKRNVKWLVKGESYDISAILPGNRKQLFPRTLFSLDCLTKDDIKKLLPDSLNIEVKRDTRPRVFIIDEINRGNISKIFGELITLIEEPKREGALEEMHAILPYSKQEFAVPNNVYILGTMNTADRSIVLMDTALRRRFDFEEMLPDTGVLRSLGIDKISFDGQDELDLSQMLDTMNKRIAYLYDREHTIGHAFFAKLANNQNIETLAEIFKKKIIPLLQEYFYDDYEKIQLVLGDNDKPNENKFVTDEKIEIQNIFKGTPGIDLSENEKTYRINDDKDYAAFKDVRSYILIYEKG